MKQGRQPTADHKTGGRNDGRMLWWSAWNEKTCLCYTSDHAEMVLTRQCACSLSPMLVVAQRWYATNGCANCFALRIGALSILRYVIEVYFRYLAIYLSGNISMTVKLAERNCMGCTDRRNLFCSLCCGWKTPCGRVEILDWIHFMLLWWSAARLHDVDRHVDVGHEASMKAPFKELG